VLGKRVRISSNSSGQSSRGYRELLARLEPLDLEHAAGRLVDELRSTEITDTTR
jgi:hypothetical protein